MAVWSLLQAVTENVKVFTHTHTHTQFFWPPLVLCRDTLTTGPCLSELVRKYLTVLNILQAMTRMETHLHTQTLNRQINTEVVVVLLVIESLK